MRILGYLLFLLVIIAGPVFADDLIPLEIRVRDAEGNPLAGEIVRIALSLSENSTFEPCFTNATGICGWNVNKGVYEVHWDRPMDDLSVLTSAENGLNSFGITVGDKPIAYHFVLHTDSRIYFDAAPNAAIPEPIIPTASMIHTHTPIENWVGEAEFSAENTANTTQESADPLAETSGETRTDTNPLWRILLLIFVGLLIGGGLHLWSQHQSGGSRHA